MDGNLKISKKTAPDNKNSQLINIFISFQGSGTNTFEVHKFEQFELGHSSWDTRSSC